MTSKAEQKVREKLAEFDDPLKSLDCVLDDAMYALTEERKKVAHVMIQLASIMGSTKNDSSHIINEVGALHRKNGELGRHVSNLRTDVDTLRQDHQRSYDEIEYLESLIRIAVAIISTTEYWKDKNPDECLKWLRRQLTHKNDGYDVYPYGWMGDGQPETHKL